VFVSKEMDSIHNNECLQQLNNCETLKDSVFSGCCVSWSAALVALRKASHRRVLVCVEQL